MCDNKVSFWIPRGYGYRERFVKCGNTTPHGGRAVCEVCANDPVIMRGILLAEQLIEQDNATSRSCGGGDY